MDKKYLIFGAIGLVVLAVIVYFVVKNRRDDRKGISIDVNTAADGAVEAVITGNMDPEKKKADADAADTNADPLANIFQPIARRSDAFPLHLGSKGERVKKLQHHLDKVVAGRDGQRINFGPHYGVFDEFTASVLKMVYNTDEVSAEEFKRLGMSDFKTFDKYQ